MARGDDLKTASRANQACKQFDVAAPFNIYWLSFFCFFDSFSTIILLLTFTCYRKPMANPPASKQEEKKKDYGAWGPIFKDKKNFTEMHLC
ncbi:hypothetical protein RR48_03745 [Papilio machaon]|uniref:Uncharacterized protein n=1 Tax=Papilio machaon TaxID=76193 RepID=A0A0N1PI40_PAPMA|nr:hypothetical protein RR48_03745 [Papilio machaon]